MLRYPNRFYILIVLLSICGLSGCSDRQNDTAANEVSPQVDVIITRVISSPVSIELLADWKLSDRQRYVREWPGS